MNNFCSSERRSGLLAFLLCGLLYAGLCALALDWVENRPAPRPSNLSAVTLRFAQMELVAVAEAPPPPEEQPERLPPEEVALEEIIEESEPDPVEATARVTQEAAAPVPGVEPNVLLSWVQEQIEREKAYPVAAQRAGYEGTFQLRVRMDADGILSDAVVVSGEGHPLLRRSLKKMLKTLPGRNFGQPLGQAVEIPFEFSFDLQ